jgi:hypothetical protein
MVLMQLLVLLAADTLERGQTQLTLWCYRECWVADCDERALLRAHCVDGKLEAVRHLQHI